MENNILIIDDDEGVVWVVEKALSKLGYNIIAKTDLKSGIDSIENKPQVILLDLVLPDGNGLDALLEIKLKSPNSNVIIISAHGRMESTIQAMKLGAFDYIDKPFDVEELNIVVEKALKDIRMREELKSLKIKQDEQKMHQMIGKDKKMIKVFKDIGRVTSKNVIVLITGESGTGKELVAKAIHYNSDRKDSPFIAINSASIPKDLLESELFGFQKGAFSGATESREGSIASADGGTLFFDEISEMDLKLQAKLLRFMQGKEYKPIGSNKAIKSDVRVIGATNKNLRKAVKEGAFREDLYYRFHVVEINLPPLRERQNDIIPLAEYFLSNSQVKFETGYKEFSKDTIEFLINYKWPGNVREMENAIKRAVIFSDGSIIDKKDLMLNETGGFSIQAFLEEKLNIYLKQTSGLKSGNLYETIVSEVEKALINIVLRENNGNQLKSSNILGINRNTLRSKIKNYKIRLKN